MCFKTELVQIKKGHNFKFMVTSAPADDKAEWAHYLTSNRYAAVCDQHGNHNNVFDPKGINRACSPKIESRLRSGKESQTTGLETSIYSDGAQSFVVPKHLTESYGSTRHPAHPSTSWSATNTTKMLSPRATSSRQGGEVANSQNKNNTVIINQRPFSLVGDGMDKTRNHKP